RRGRSDGHRAARNHVPHRPPIRVIRTGPPSWRGISCPAGTRRHRGNRARRPGARVRVVDRRGQEGGLIPMAEQHWPGETGVYFGRVTTLQALPPTKAKLERDRRARGIAAPSRKPTRGERLAQALQQSRDFTKALKDIAGGEVRP